MADYKTPVNRAQLDKLVCSDPDCTHEHDHGPIYLHGRCHQDTPTWAQYHNGVLAIRCAQCDNVIVRIQVADEKRASTN